MTAEVVLEILYGQFVARDNGRREDDGIRGFELEELVCASRGSAKSCELFALSTGGQDEDFLGRVVLNILDVDDLTGGRAKHTGENSHFDVCFDTTTFGHHFAPVLIGNAHDLNHTGEL